MSIEYNTLFLSCSAHSCSKNLGIFYNNYTLVTDHQKKKRKKRKMSKQIKTKPHSLFLWPLFTAAASRIDI